LIAGFAAHGFRELPFDAGRQADYDFSDANRSNQLSLNMFVVLSNRNCRAVPAGMAAIIISITIIASPAINRGTLRP
jgi:hypothetical protein